MPNLETYTSPMLFEDKAYYIPQVLGNLFGLNTGYFIQELHWRLRGVRQGKAGALDVNGRPWFFRSLNAYVREFSHIKGMGRSTIQKTIKFLEAEGILLKWEEANPKYWGGSRTWYSLNYEKLTALYFQYLKDHPEPVVKGELQPDLGDEIDEAGGMLQSNIPQGKGYVATQHTSMPQGNIHTESTTENPDHRVDRPADAEQSAPPLEQKKTPTTGQSYISQAPTEKRDRSKEMPATPTGNEDSRLPYDSLSMLGKFLVALSNKGAQLPEGKGTKTLTAKQSATLATPLSFYLNSGEHITISPDELYETDPLFKTWLEHAVHPVLRKYSGNVKPISRKLLVTSVTLGRNDFSLKAFYEWRKKAQYKDWQSVVPDEELVSPPTGESTMQVAVLSDEELAAIFGDEDETEGSADTDEQE